MTCRKRSENDQFPAERYGTTRHCGLSADCSSCPGIHQALSSALMQDVVNGCQMMSYINDMSTKWQWFMMIHLPNIFKKKVFNFVQCFHVGVFDILRLLSVECFLWLALFCFRCGISCHDIRKKRRSRCWNSLLSKHRRLVQCRAVAQLSCRRKRFQSTGGSTFKKNQRKSHQKFDSHGRFTKLDHCLLKRGGFWRPPGLSLVVFEAGKRCTCLVTFLYRTVTLSETNARVVNDSWLDFLAKTIWPV